MHRAQRPSHAPAALVLAVIPLLAIAPSVAALTAREQRVKEQQDENRGWEKAARDLQSKCHRRAEVHYKDKEYSEAIKLYRKVGDITYPQWELRERYRVGRVRGEEKTVTVPAIRKTRKKLVTPLNEKAKDRIEDIGTARLAASAEELYADAERLIEQGKPGPAYGLLKRISGNRLPRDLYRKYGARVSKHMKDIEAEAGKFLADLAKSIADKDLDKAREVFHMFRAKYGEFAESDEIHEQYAVLVKGDELQALLRSEAADERLALALKALEDDDPVAAFDQFKEIAKLYADTEAGARAAAKVAEMRADKLLMRKIANQRAGDICETLLRNAANYRANGLDDKARATYQKIVQRYPDTDYADEARKALQELAGGGEE